MADKRNNNPASKQIKSKKSEVKKETTKKKGFLRNNDDVMVDDTGTGPIRKDDADNSIIPMNDNRAKWANKIMNEKPIRKVSREFIENKKIKRAEYTTEYCERNDARNRYNDIICIDQTRVVLRDRGEDDNYIHGSWLGMPDGQKYICTQGPTADTVEDFWHMIFCEKSTVVVMLCSLTEGKHEKCYRYYPKSKDSPEQFGSYRVTVKSVEADPFEGVKYQILTVETGRVCQIVHHLAYPNWPDHTAPEKPTASVGMYRMSRRLCGHNPITVHCSAGIGRTATFVGIDYAVQKIKTDANTSMVEVLRELRNQRHHAIQSPVQYMFLHICLLDIFADEGIISRKGKYAAYLDSYTSLLKRYTAKIAQMENN